MGFPPRAWFDVERLARQYHGVWTLLIDNVMKWDPEYFEDFWTVPGYLGFDPPESLARSRVQLKTTVTNLVMRDEAMTLGLPLPRLLNVAPLAETAGGRPCPGPISHELGRSDLNRYQWRRLWAGALCRRRGGWRPGNRLWTRQLTRADRCLYRRSRDTG